VALTLCLPRQWDRQVLQVRAALKLARSEALSLAQADALAEFSEEADAIFFDAMAREHRRGG
jgi:hypothetical protein